MCDPGFTSPLPLYLMFTHPMRPSMVLLAGTCSAGHSIAIADDPPVPTYQHLLYFPPCALSFSPCAHSFSPCALSTPLPPIPSSYSSPASRRVQDCLPSVPANGFRSLLLVVRKVCEKLTLAAWASHERRPPKPTQAFSDLIAVMRCLSKLLLMTTMVARELDDDSLFLPPGHEDTTKMVLASVQAVDMAPCYGLFLCLSVGCPRPD